MTVQQIDPATGRALRLRAADEPASDGYPIVNGVPRICGEDNYAGNFGYQWNRFPGTQIDAQDESDHSRLRFFAETGWSPESLAGLDVLEVGSGAGRFSEVVLKHTSARLWSVDYSAAVEANWATNAALGGDRFHLFQASVYEMPFAANSFDRVFCLGVLQHTPDFEKSVHALVEKAKPGGLIAVDFYPIRGFWTKLNAKYILRPITKRMDNERLLKLIDRNADWLIAAHRGLHRVGLGALTRFLPICDFTGTMPDKLSGQRLREWVVLDTFDQYSPEFDQPQRLRDVAAMFERAGADVTFADFVALGDSGSAAVVRATKRA